MLLRIASYQQRISMETCASLVIAIDGMSIRVSNAVITIAIRLRSDYDVSHAPASNSTQAKNEHAIFRRSRIVVESQL